MKKKNLLMTTLATLSASGALLTTGANALADSYTVVKNDTLWGLSKKYGVSVSDLKKANGVSGHLIYVGQKLQIPTKSTKTAKTSTSTRTVDTTSTTHTVVKGDTLWSLAKKYGVSVKALMKANNLSSSTILIGQSLNLRAGMTTYGVNGVTTGSSSTAASTNTASSTSTTASSQAPKAKKKTTKAKSTTTNTSASANTQSQSTASNSSASTTTNTNTAASNANTTSSTNTAATTNTASSTNTAAANTNTAASSSQAVSQAPTGSTSTTSTASASASAITSYALTFLGVPYVWGGTTPSGFDCSGLVQYVYSHFGINLGRTTYTQQYAGTKISVASAQAGDLYFWGSYGSAYHVAIALGGGQYVMAPAPGQNVMTGSVSSYTPSFAVRVLG